MKQIIKKRSEKMKLTKSKNVKIGDTIKTWWGKMVVENINIEKMKNGKKKYNFVGVNLGGGGTIVGQSCFESKYENSKVKLY